MSRLRHAARIAVDNSRRLVGEVFPQQPRKLASDAAAYWADPAGRRFAGNSHWRSAPQFAHGDLWQRMGHEHLDLYRRLSAASASEPAAVRHVVDWGCGGGANATAFAAIAGHMTGVDVSAASLAECSRQMVAEVPGTEFTPVLADLETPEKAAAQICLCELFLCLYVLELVPDQAYGLRLMRIARDLLAPGGQAFIQVKYSDGSWRARTRKRGYRSDIAGTTYRIGGFWTAMTDTGFRPEAVTLVPRNELDERYAYFLLTRP